MTPKEIVTVLETARYFYYNSDEERMSDTEFDTLELQLKKLDPDNVYFSTIGSDVRGGKIELPHKMGSLDQVYENEAEKWIKDNGWENEFFVITNKLDGTSGINIHDSRGLKVAYSRGNGTRGADITRHVKRFKNLPDVDTPCVVRVEYIITEESFKKILEANPDRVFKNARNYTAGRMNASDGDDLFYEHVECIATSVIEPKMSKEDQLEFLQDLGYYVPRWRITRGCEINDEILKIRLEDQRETSPYAMDGLVIDIDDLTIRESLTRKSSSLNPMFAKKFKIGDAANLATTKVISVDWNISKTGYLKPRVQVEPVELAGATVQYASGFNAKFIKERGIGPGAIINITRSGDVIPYILQVVTPVTPSFPDYEHMKWTENGVDLYLTEMTDDQAINQLIAAFTALEVEGLKEGSILKLWDVGYSTLESIIKTKKVDLVKWLGVNGEKIYNSLHHRLNPITKANLAGSSQVFGRGLGRRRFRKIFDAYPDLTFEELTHDQILTVDGFSDITASGVMQGLSDFLDFLDKIKGYYTFEVKETKMNVRSLEAHHNVVFTGVRSKELEALIEAGGGTIGSSISSKTTLLICKDPTSTSGKMQKAHDLGIRCVTLEDAEEMFKA